MQKEARKKARASARNNRLPKRKKIVSARERGGREELRSIPLRTPDKVPDGSSVGDLEARLARGPSMPCWSSPRRVEAGQFDGTLPSLAASPRGSSSSASTRHRRGAAACASRRRIGARLNPPASPAASRS